MRRIGISQRVDMYSDVGEVRDCLDQRWIKFILSLGYFPIPLPTLSPRDLEDNWRALGLSAVILSGGNNIEDLAPGQLEVSPARDAFERKLLALAIENRLPVLGVCRGMQLINLFFGGTATAIEHHVGGRHRLKRLSDGDFLPTEVNSFHNFGISRTDLAVNLKPLALDMDGNIEAFTAVGASIVGIMWHPERDEPHHAGDIQLLMGLFN